MRIKIYGLKIEDYNPNEAIILWFLTPIAGVGVSLVQEEVVLHGEKWGVSFGPKLKQSKGGV